MQAGVTGVDIVLDGVEEVRLGVLATRRLPDSGHRESSRRPEHSIHLDKLARCDRTKEREQSSIVRLLRRVAGHHRYRLPPRSRIRRSESMSITRIGTFTLGWGESLIWDEQRQRLYFVDCAAQTVHWLDDGDDELHTLHPPSMPTGLVPA